LNNIITDTTTEFIAKTFAGTEELLAGELAATGATDIRILKRAVAFSGTTEHLYRANYTCRTALRILKPIFIFDIETEEDLYKQIYSLAWEKIFSLEQTFAIDSFVHESVLTHSLYVSLKAKDAIADHFRDNCGRRPSVDTNHPDIRINLHLAANKVTLSLDSSGESLHKRGYRIAQGPAPISEALGAALIMFTGWNGQCNFFDPMCGSGTLVTEAAMIAQKIPAGYYRSSFGFMNWNDFDKALWEKIVDEENAKICESDCEIHGSDNSQPALDNAIKNISNARLHRDIELHHTAMADFDFPEGPGIIVTNPPYGERMQEEDLVALYQSMGDTLKKKCNGYDAWIISSGLDAFKFLGLKPTKKMTLYNGPLECRYACFSVYEGSKKTKYNEAASPESTESIDVEGQIEESGQE
jgi:putative N6-adenine-specific DNA methylase